MNKLIWMCSLFFLLISLSIADTLKIKIDQNSFDLPYWPAEEPHYGGVLIVKGGEPSQWSSFLAQVAKKLADHGWSVVLLNCMNEHNSTWITQVPEAIGELRRNKNKRIILIHYGEQLNQSLEYFIKPQAKMINGLVLLSAYDEQTTQDKRLNLRFPLFDIAGQFDYDEVLNQMQTREQTFNKNQYHAVEMPGAEHDYEHSQKLLVAYLHGWMSKLPESRIQSRPISVSYVPSIYTLDSYLVSFDSLSHLSLTYTRGT